jgi:prepilin-type N-terminal cleavage/methylation domain-containing protein
MDKIKNDKGFTLLEVIFAVSILAVGILAVASMQVSSIRGNAFAWRTTEASTVAMGQIERLMDLSYIDTNLTNGNHTIPVVAAVNGHTYNVTWIVVDDQPIDRTKTVRLTVSWTDHGLPRNVSMTFTLGQVV